MDHLQRLRDKDSMNRHKRIILTKVKKILIMLIIRWSKTNKCQNKNQILYKSIKNTIPNYKTKNILIVNHLSTILPNFHLNKKDITIVIVAVKTTAIENIIQEKVIHLNFIEFNYQHKNIR
jgi:hypothetical protein